MRRFRFAGEQPERLLPRYQRPRRPHATLLGAILVATMLAGCSAPFGTGTAPTRAPTATVWSPPPTATPIPVVTAQQAWGEIQYRKVPTALPDGRVFVFENAATPDGQWLVGEAEPRNFIENTTRPEFLVLYNVRTLEVKTLRQLQHPQSQILLGASLDGDWLAWAEADDNPTFFDWTLSVYNLRTGQSREVARAVRQGGKPVPGPWVAPIVSAGRLIWGQAVGPVGSDTLDNAVVRLEDLATGSVTTLATRAGAPQLEWPWAAWGQFGATNDEGYEVIRNLETGEEHRLDAKPASLAMAGTSMVYDDEKTAYLVDDFTHDPVQALAVARAIGLADYIQYVSLNDRLIGWIENEATRVYDRADRRLVDLPVTGHSSDSWVGGRLLIWTQPEPDDKQLYDSQHNLTPTPTLNVLDTTTLPVLGGP